MGRDIREVLAENLERLFAFRGIASADKAEAELRVPKSTVDRAWRNRSDTRIGTINDLAVGLKIQPWQLLVPDLDPGNLPTLSTSFPPNAEEIPIKTTVVPSEVAELIAVYCYSDEIQRAIIMKAIGAAKSLLTRTSNDKPEIRR